MWPAFSWLDSLVGRALHRYRRGHGFESRSGLNFFRLYFHNCLSCVYNCDDQSWFHIFFAYPSQHFNTITSSFVKYSWTPLFRTLKKSEIVDNYSPKWRCERLGKISTTFTDTAVNNCFSIYHTSWITSGPKSNFTCLRVTLFQTESHFVFLRLLRGE